ncbi:MAG: response regulator [Myxococcaceae bacterium]|nr:response regulator [Myxococcaceae bacterium]
MSAPADVLLAIASNIAQPIWSVNAKNELTWSNRHFEEHFGAAFAADAHWLPLYQRALETKQPVHGDESIEVGGQQRQFAISIFPVGDQVAAMCRETTTQMKLYSANERLLREAAERASAERVRATIQQQMMLADRLTSVGTLAAGVAHEINNPLAAVLVNLQLAQEDTEALAEKGVEKDTVEHLRDELRDAAAACDRVKHIIRDLKVFARNSERDAAGPINVHQVLELSMRMAQNEIRHRARLVKNLDAVAAVHGNEARLGQVFLNLLVNAAQAIEDGNAEGNEIRVTARSGREGFVEVEVSDTGCGITPENLPHIFDPFFSTKPTGEGMGLGLSIAHQIVTSMGGTIAVRTEVGKGSAFMVSLPAAATVTLVTSPEAGDHLPVHRGKILSIDDEPMVGTFVRRILSSQHEVEVVTSALAALERIKGGERYDVILCDVMMPQMSGLDLYWELHNVAADLAKRMVFLTAGAFTASSRAFFELTTNPRLEKPFDAQALRLLVNRIINKTGA